MGFFDELNQASQVQSVTLSSGAGTATFGAAVNYRSVVAVVITNAGGTTTSGATFTLKQGSTSLTDWAIPNGYTQDATVVKTPSGTGPMSLPTGAGGPQPATGATSAVRQVLPPNVPITLAIASGTASDVLSITLVTVPGGNVDANV